MSLFTKEFLLFPKLGHVSTFSQMKTVRVRANRHVVEGWSDETEARVIRYLLLWSLGLGFVGLMYGFISPMFNVPNTGQMPLVGIFITGPLGFVIGGIVGYIHGSNKKK